MEHDGLIYIGEGTAIIGVPARDLTAEEADQRGRDRLIASGLYRDANPEQEEKRVFTPKPRKAAAVKATEAEKEN